MKINKTKLIISLFIILLPMLVGLILWNVLPDVMDTHWGISGQVDGRGGKIVPVIVLPLIMLITHLICMLITVKDNSNKNQTSKALGIIYWICPGLSLYTSAIIYALNFGLKFNAAVITFIPIGILFIAVGNYMPKCRRNLTLGVKLSWTLSSEANWNATHRLAGKVWVAGGVVLLLAAFIPYEWVLTVMFSVIAVMVIVPTVYSYLFYKRELAQGKTEKVQPMSRHYGKKTMIAVRVTVGAILVFVVIVLFMGSVSVEYLNDGIKVKATLWGSRTIEYTDIDNVEYKNTNKAGAKLNGVNSLRYNAGIFQNTALGMHDRYAYTKADSSVVIYELDGDIIVISLTTDEQNRELYDTLLAQIGGGKQ